MNRLASLLLVLFITIVIAKKNQEKCDSDECQSTHHNRLSRMEASMYDVWNKMEQLEHTMMKRWNKLYNKFNHPNWRNSFDSHIPDWHYAPHLTHHQPHKKQLSKYDPFESDLTNYFDNIMTNQDLQLSSFHTDIVSQDNKYIVHADLPGLNKNKIKVQVVPNTVGGCRLSIEGSRDESKKLEKDNYITQERHYGKYYRSFLLPKDVTCEKENVIASYKNGVLQIDIPKLAIEEPKKTKEKQEQQESENDIVKEPKRGEFELDIHDEPIE